MVELLAVVTVMGLAMSAAATGLQSNVDDLEQSERLTESFFRLARARAMSTTSAVKVLPSNAGRLYLEQASTCSDATWSTHDELELRLPDGVRFDNVGWTVCFSSRGVADRHVVVDLSGPSNRGSRVEVTLGGGARIVR